MGKLAMRPRNGSHDEDDSSGPEMGHPLRCHRTGSLMQDDNDQSNHGKFVLQLLAKLASTFPLQKLSVHGLSVTLSVVYTVLCFRPSLGLFYSGDL
jgi:hypothetical protein